MTPWMAKLRAATSQDELDAGLAEARAALGETDAYAAVAAVAQDALSARLALKGATRVREVLLASVAHDLRNPLNTFAMSAGLLKDDIDSNEVDRTRGLALLSRMERASQRMQGQIDDLVEASRVDAGAIEMVSKRELASAVIEAAVAKAKPLVTEKGASLVTTDAPADLAFTCHRARTAIAIAKLVSVALKSTGEGAAIRLGAEVVGGAPTLTLRATAPRATTSAQISMDEARGGISLVIGRGLLTAQGATLATEITDEGPRLLVSFPA